MYDNIGGKLKTVAKVVGIGGAILCGIILVISLIAAAVIGEWGAVALIIILSLIFIPLCIIISYPLYGFGELIEKAGEIAENTANPVTTPMNTTPKPSAKNTAKPATTPTNSKARQSAGNITKPKPVKSLPDISTATPVASGALDGSAKYQQLYKGKEPIYTPSSPLVIESFALLQDSQGGQIAQVEFRNISEEAIYEVYVIVECWDANGKQQKSLCKVYNDLYIRGGESFGEKAAIYLPDNATQKIAVTVCKVQYEYDDWEAPADAEWEAYAF